MRALDKLRMRMRIPLRREVVEPEARGETPLPDRWLGAAGPAAAVRPATTLQELLGTASVRHALDFAAGNGGWARAVLADAELGWRAPDVQVAALELDAPQGYTPDLAKLETAPPGFMRLHVPNLGQLTSRTSAWPIVDFREVARSALPPGQPGFDLIHESFLDPNAAWLDGGQRLDWFVELLAPGGKLLLTHTVQSDLNPGLQFADWATRRGHTFQFYSGPNVPPDYPRSYWFDYFYSHGPESVFVVAVSPKGLGTKRE